MYKKKWDLEKYFFKSLDDVRIKQNIDKYVSLEKEHIAYFKENSLAKADAKLLLKYFEDVYNIQKVTFPVYLYYMYLSSIDSQNQEVIKKQMVLDDLTSELHKESLFMNEDLKKLGYKKLISLSNDPILEKNKNAIVDIANSIKYNLPIEIEKVIVEKDNSGIDITVSMYEEYVNSFEYLFKGEYVTESEVRKHLSDTDENIRLEAYNSLYEVYGSKQTQIILGNTYLSIVKNNVSEMKMRKMKHVMESRNLSENLDDSVVNNMLDIVQNNFPLYHRYSKIKSKLLGKDYLNDHDRNAPYKKLEKEYDFESGLNIYLDIIKDFDQYFYDYSVEMFKEGRVDIYPKKSKRGGAFAQFVKDSKSFVLLNYTNEVDDVLTLAHELGHAIHGDLSQVQETSVYSSPLCLAETASIFNETLVYNYLTNNAEKDEKVILLIEQIDSIFNTIFRQTVVTLFEREIHNRTLDGEPLTYVDFNRIWRKHTSDFYGENIKFNETPDKDCKWSYIPHIYRTPFYCYTYSFGNILSLSLYEKYLENKEEFMPMYKDILKSGGSVPPKELLLKYDIDISKDDFFNKSMDYISRLIDELETTIQ